MIALAVALLVGAALLVVAVGDQIRDLAAEYDGNASVAGYDSLENALLPQSHGGDRDEAWVDELLETLAVADRADRYPATLSGGEKQRVAIARALANRPEVVLADEPTGQLDPETTDRVAGLLLDVQASADTALVAISHEPSLEGLFDRTARLRDRRLVETPTDDG